MWKPPSISLFWPPFFRTDAAEQQQVVAMASLALQSNMITRRMALEKLRSVFPFENIEAVLTHLDEQVEETAKHSVENLLEKAMKADEEKDDAASKQSGEEQDEEAPPSR
jgi:hypothetical protein